MNHREIDQSKNDICIWNLHILNSCTGLVWWNRQMKWMCKCNKWNYEIINKKKIKLSA